MNKKYKTWNNWIAKDIFRSVTCNKPRSAFYLIYNCHEQITDDLLFRFLFFIVQWYKPAYEDYDSIQVLQGLMEISQVDYCVQSFVISTFNRLKEGRCL